MKVCDINISKRSGAFTLVEADLSGENAGLKCLHEAGE
jgi:hypothetical protein